MSFKDLDIKVEYRSLSQNVANCFLIPALKQAIVFDRAVGFFSSSSLARTAEGIHALACNNGKIRLVASPYLSKDDAEAIRAGYKNRDETIRESILAELKEPQNQKEEYQLNLLSNLISDGYLDIKIAFIENRSQIGMYHEKLGIIIDSEGNTIAYSGSMNESELALEINYETIDVFRSWKNEYEDERVEAKKNAFESIWNDNESGIKIIDFPDLKDQILNRYLRNKIDYQRIETELINGLDSDISNTHNYLGARKPIDFILYDYQIEAIENWVNNSYRGIFDMATGTGKTYTGLGAVARLNEALKGELAVIIVCPYQHLVEQWVEDIELFNMQPIIGYSSSCQKDWKRRLEEAIRNQKLRVKGKEFFCFVCTNATYSSDFVQNQLNKIKGNVLFVVDEAHNFGAYHLGRLLNDKFNYRLALSATLERHHDDEGTRKLYEYFGTKCITYDLERAINEKKLTPYKYYPVFVTLTDLELNKYYQLTEQISREIKKDKHGNLSLTERGKRLCLARARLVAAAEYKINALREQIIPYVNDNHILVYCGAASLHDYSQDGYDVDTEDLRQIDIVTDLLGNSLDMKVSQYTSKEDIEERKILKEQFADGQNLQALIAIKCLDEGVNIPSIKTAFILASTTNPKEYIQRRGRVLRLYPGKEFAYIYDFITLPKDINSSFGSTEREINMAKGLVRNELSRAFEFARLADNYVQANSKLEEIRDIYDIHDEIYDLEEEFDYYE